MRLYRSSLWNLVGGVIPAAAAFVTVPLVVSRLGEVHYGLLTLITSIVGYFALLDVNATQGSVKYLAEYKTRQDLPRMRQVFCLGAGLYLVIGAVGGLSIAWFAQPLATGVFNVPAALHQTAVQALQYGGIAFFFAQLQVYLLSVPQSVHRFDLSARSEVVFGSLASVSTVFIVWLGGGIVEIMAARAAIAAANVIWLARTAAQLLPDLRMAWPGRDVVQKLMSFSLFSYLSRISSVTYASADKLLIGAYVDMQALAFYSVPFLLVNRLYALTYRLGSVMLPEASRLDAIGQPQELRRKYLLAARYLLFVNTCIAVLLLTLGRELLWHWAGPSFGAHANAILVLLVVAALVETVSNLPSHVNDGLGRPAITGVFSVVRAAVGLLAAWLAVQSHGILGVAWAQLLVPLVMVSAFLVWVHGRVIPATLGDFLRVAVLPSLWPALVGVAAAVAGLGREPVSLQWMLGLGVVVAMLLMAYGYWVVLQTDHRAAVVAQVQQRLQAMRARRA
jgi:O-antigen/teichoic acid export membrane protein